MTPEAGYGLNAKRWIAPAMLGIALGAISCSGNAEAVKSDVVATPTPSATPETATNKANALWGDATFDLRTKVAKGVQMTLRVANGVCAAWPASIEGIYTVVHNPVLYDFAKGTQTLAFLPFVPSSPQKPEIMNGPYQYINTADKGPDGLLSSLNGVTFSNGKEIVEFKEFRSTFTLRQDAHPTPFTAGWIEAETGKRVAETKLVEIKDIDRVFNGECHLPINSQTAQSGIGA
jgi:hypothetical protein